MLKTKLQQFEGPLDLLLALIEEQKLDITQIALAQVTEQFLAYLKQLENIEPSNLADYLAIAAKLLVIKSKAILPSLEVETDEEETGVDLEAKLLLYKQFKEVARHLKHLDNRRKQGFLRSISFEERINFYPDPELNAQSLHNSILGVLNQLKELDNLPKARIKEAISIQEKIDHLRTHIGNQVETKLSDIIQHSKNKDEVIVTFLALLELIKQRVLVASQETLFNDITIKKVEKQLEPKNGGHAAE